MSPFGLDPRFVASGLLGGFAIGLTGMGGGAILTPLLLALGVPPSTAIGSDLIASIVMKPVAGSVHARAKTVRWDLVRWLTVGSVPAAFVGVAASRLLTRHGDAGLRRAIGLALIVAATAIVVRTIRLRRQASADRDRGPSAGKSTGESTVESAPMAPVRRLPTVVIGVVGGFLVGLTSVGSGSLMLVALAILYPRLASAELVGTDVVQAVPLVGAAALGHVLIGDFKAGLTLALLIGGIPGAYVGARLSSGSATRFIRPALLTVLVASATKLIIA